MRGSGRFLAVLVAAVLVAAVLLAGACSGGPAPRRADPAPTGTEGARPGGPETGAAPGGRPGAGGGGSPGAGGSPAGSPAAGGNSSPGGATPAAGGESGPGDPTVTGGGWRRIADAPISGRHSHSAVWTGTEMIVWGGAGRAGNAPIYVGDGAAYDPAADRWRRLAPSPLAPRADHTAVWTGREMLVWGGNPGIQTPFGSNEFVDGAAYDPAADRWRPMARFPLAPRFASRALWTGRLLVVWGGARAEDGADPAPLADGAAYDPAADRWTALPAAPIAGRLSPLAAATDGGVLFSWGFGPGNRGAADSALYDPRSRRWRPAAPAPPPDSTWCFDLAGCVGIDTGRRVVFAGEGLVWDQEADRWSRIAGSPFADPFLDGKALAWTGTRVVLWGGGRYEGDGPFPPGTVATDPAGMAYDPAADRWEPLPPAPVASRARTRAVWTGTEVVVWGGESTYRERLQYADGAAWRPGA